MTQLHKVHQILDISETSKTPTPVRLEAKKTVSNITRSLGWNMGQNSLNNKLKVKYEVCRSFVFKVQIRISCVSQAKTKTKTFCIYFIKELMEIMHIIHFNYSYFSCREFF